MKVFYIPCGSNQKINIGDNVYFQGSKELITQVYGKHEVLYINNLLFKFKQAFKFKKVEYLEEMKNLTPDLIVISGGPMIHGNFNENWFGDTFEWVYKKFPNVPKLAFGLGADCGLYSNGALWGRKDTLERINKVFKDYKLICTRDIFCNETLRRAGLDPQNECDSASFFPIDYWKIHLNLQITQERPVLVFTHLSRIKDRKRQEQNKKRMQVIVKKYNPIVFCVHKEELRIMEELGIEGKYLHTYKEILPILAQAKFVISGRVHMSILARLLDKKTYLIPYDIRYLSATPLDIVYIDEVEPILNERNNSPHTQVRIQNSKERIIKKLKALNIGVNK